jgi:hypothetical protein
MSDHVDGPRTTADPAIDLTDLYAFISPENPKRMVLIANVFPGAGDSALFSNAVSYSIAVRQIRLVATGDAARFEAKKGDVRFTFEFETLKPLPDRSRPRQTGACKLPGGETLNIVVNDEQGSATADNLFRVFAGLRSDPFFIGWLPLTPLKNLPNYVEEDNVLSLVIEFDTARVLKPDTGSLFGAVAETTPRAIDSLRNPPPRFDWVGRPEVTNFLLNVADTADLRDLWNQQTPFAISDELLPVFRKRLAHSLELWDIRDGNAHWTPAALAANVNVFLDDFLLFDAAKPITDASHLEIEKSTIDGRPYETGGGRTLDANAVDILVTWVINRDRGPFQQSGATGATQPGGKTFPYVRPPNKMLLTVTQTADLLAPPDEVWALIGQFDGTWHPLVATLQTTGTGVGQLRRIKTIDGKIIIERLEEIDNAKRGLRYSMVSGIPAARYEGTIQVRPKGAGSAVTWQVNYRPEGQTDLVVRTIVSTLLKTGLDSLKLRFGSPP